MRIFVFDGIGKLIGKINQKSCMTVILFDNCGTILTFAVVAVVIGGDGIDFRGAVFAETFDIACNVIFELGDKTFDDFGVGITDLSGT
jgi:hypothetical protein